jgi:hypothetical protein
VTTPESCSGAFKRGSQRKLFYLRSDFAPSSILPVFNTLSLTNPIYLTSHLIHSLTPQETSRSLLTPSDGFVAIPFDTLFIQIYLLRRLFDERPWEPGLISSDFEPFLYEYSKLFTTFRNEDPSINTFREFSCNLKDEKGAALCTVSPTESYLATLLLERKIKEAPITRGIQFLD